jgi:hypothetical protein
MVGSPGFLILMETKLSFGNPKYGMRRIKLTESALKFDYTKTLPAKQNRN